MNLNLLRLPLLLLTGFALSGCAVAGERASLPEGACPAGEVCSDQTPHGLSFTGVQLSDTFALFAPTAVGGTQTISALQTGGDGGSESFETPFDAASSVTSVVMIDSVKPPSVVVRGVAEGTSLLRLLEPGTAKLFDRVELHVEPVTKVTVHPLELLWLDKEDAPWALLSGSPAQLTVRIWGQGDHRLADETATLMPDTGEVTQKAWDLFEVTAPSPGEISFQGKTGGGDFSAKAQVVSAIDDITLALQESPTTGPIPVNLDADSILCFIARSSGVAVAGATWSFAPSESVKLNQMDPESLNPLGCVSLRGVTAGPATIAVTASGLARTFDLTVSKQQTTSLQRDLREQRIARLRPLAGERALQASSP